MALGAVAGWATAGVARLANDRNGRMAAIAKGAWRDIGRSSPRTPFDRGDVSHVAASLLPLPVLRERAGVRALAFPFHGVRPSRPDGADRAGDAPMDSGT